MSRYLVTGGCGFIGANLVHSLVAAGDEVCVVDNLSTGQRNAIPAFVDFVQADVADSIQMTDLLGPDYDGCFHLAANPSVAQSLVDYTGCHRTNLTGTIAIFDAASKAGTAKGKPVPVVYASSCAVYGTLETLPLTEDMPTFPISSYGVDKLCGELHGCMAADAYGLKSVGLRFFNVYGVGQRPTSPYSGVLSIFCNQLGRKAQPTIYGDGKQTRDFIYVDDVVDCIKMAMAQAIMLSPAVLNVCTGNGTSLIEIGSQIANECDINFEPRFAAPRQGDIKFSVGNPEWCRERLGWESQIGIMEGLRRTLNWQESQFVATKS